MDVGTHTIKAVEIRSGYKGFEVVNCAEVSSSDGLSRLFSQDSVKGSAVVTALPQASMRIISLPFRDERKIEQVTPFEIEPFIPFPLDDVVVSWHILSGTEGPSQEGTNGVSGGSDILVAAAPKIAVREWLGRLSRDGIDPMVVDLDAVVAAGLCRWTHAEDSPLAFLEFGGSKSSLTVVSQGRLSFARAIPYGSDDITGAIEKGCGLSRVEAEERKIADGLEGEDKNLTAVVSGSLDGLVHQVSQTLLSAEETVRIKAEKLLLYGGGARLRGIREFLSGRLQCDVGFLTPSLSLPSGCDILVYGKALALALRVADPTHGTSTINFRKGEFAFRPPREEIAGMLRTSGALVGAGIFLGLVSIAASLTMKEARLRKLIQEERQVFTTAFPGVPTPDDPLSEMQERVSRERIGRGTGGTSSVLDILKEMSSKIPKDVKVDILEMNIDSAKIRLLGATDTLESVDRIVKELKNSGAFSDITILDARRSSDGNIVNFQLSLSVKESS